jgi:hypothetical protein
MGDAFFHHNWHMAVNAYWSPLYPWIQGLFLRLLKPSAYWEYPAVHLVNFLIYIGALASFEFFLSAIVKLHRNLAEGPVSAVGLPEWAWYLLGRLTFGDTGRVNYESYVDGNALWFPAGSALKHPVPRLVERPPTYEFRTPVGGTYPLWYDPSYWHEGLVPHFGGRGESKVLVRTLRKYVHLVFSPRLELYLVIGCWPSPGCALADPSP